MVAALLVAALSLFGSPVFAAPAAFPEAPTVDIHELRRGQVGYGMTVFAGSEPERFEVEVLGVQKATEVAGLDYLIAKLSGRGLEKIGVAGGMSGSPVYFDGRLAGAVAFTFNFASEPIAGITPIAAMRAIPNTAARLGILPGLPPSLPPGLPPSASLRHPAPRPASLPAPSLAALLDDQPPGAEAFTSVLDLLAPPAPAGGRSALTFAAAGLGAGVEKLFAGRLGPLAVAPPAALASAVSSEAAASATTAVAHSREVGPGDSVALVMARGDLGFAAVGTVTDRTGDQLVAFGHRVLGGLGGVGPVRFPMATAEVITVMPSLQGSFKMANVGPLVGSFLEDRGPGSRAMVGPVWPMTPLRIKINPADGGPARHFAIDVASDQLFRGFSMAVATVGAIVGAGRDQGAQSVDLDVRYQLQGHGDVAGRHSFIGGQAAVEAAFQVMEYATYFAFNEFEPIEIDAAFVEVTLREEERRTRVMAAWPDRRKVKPGETLGFYVELEDYRGERRRERLEFPIPQDAVGRFYLMIGDGRSADAAYAQVEREQPKTLEEGLELLRQARSSRNLHVIGLQGGPGIAFSGRPLPDLPGSQRALLGRGAEAALPWRIAGEKVIPLDRAAAGMVRIDLEVERR